MEQLAERSQNCLRHAMKSFNEKDTELARKTRHIAAEGKGLGDLVFEDLVKESENSNTQIRYLFDVLILIGRLKRVCDRCKNICEETLFSVAGESKPAKKHCILFLDEENTCRSQIAEAVARKSYPSGGEYSSAGRRKGADLKPELRRFMEGHGLTLGTIETKALKPDPREIERFDIVISLHGPVNTYIPEQPFRTVFLDWDIGVSHESVNEGESNERYTELYREITTRVCDLMETLRGKESV